MNTPDQRREEARPSRRTATVSIAVVAFVVSGFSLVSRLIHAAVSGDRQSVDAQLLSASIAVPIIVLLLIAISLQFLPGQLRSARLRRSFPSEIVVTGRMNHDTRVLFRGWNLPSATDDPVRLPWLTFGLTASTDGIAFWGMVRNPARLGVLLWNEVTNVAVTDRVIGEKKYPQLQVTFLGSRKVAFSVASGRNLGRSLASTAELEALAQRLQALEAGGSSRQ